MKGIADTGFIVGFANRTDEHHEWATNIGEQVTEPLLTCESVLAEATHHLKDARIVLGMVRDGFLALALDCSKHIEPLALLASRYADRKPDFADLCLIRMSELFPKHPVITVDRADFRVYRRNKRETIPLICPPGKFP